MTIRTTAIALAITLCATLLTGAVYVRFCVARTNCVQTTVKVVVGSEKAAFLNDPRVQDVFADNGLHVLVTPKGSRDIGDAGLNGFDLAFPSSTLAAEKIMQDRPQLRRKSPFFSPMVVATYKDFAEALQRAGIARPSRDGWTFDVERYLDQVENGLRWKDIPGATGLPAQNGNLVLVSTTDPRSSNSAAMYVAITSHVWNGHQIADTPDDVAALGSKIGAKLFLAQGATQPTTEEPFEVYTAPLGKSRAPMVLLYEAQFVGAKVTDRERLTDDMVLMYPTPTVVADHAYVPLTPNGEKLGTLLRDNPELVRLAVEHGFRVNDNAVFTSVLKEKGIKVPEQLNVVPAPAYSTLEGFLNAIQRMYG